MADDTVGNRDFGNGHLPARGCGVDQHRPGAGGSLSKLRPRVRDRRRAARTLEGTEEQVVVFRRIRGREFGAHLRPVGVEFFRNNRRQSGRHTLAFVEVLNQHRDRVVRADLYERPHFRLRDGLRRSRGCRVGRSGAADHETCTGQSDDLKKRAPVDSRCHVSPPARRRRDGSRRECGGR